MKITVTPKLTCVSLDDWKIIGPQLEILAKRELPKIPEIVEALPNPKVNEREIFILEGHPPARFTYRVCDYAMDGKRRVQISHHLNYDSDAMELRPQD